MPYAAISALSIGDTAAADGLETQFDDTFATLLTNTMVDIRQVAKDRARRIGRFLDLLITYNGSAPTTLTSPFRLKVFMGVSLADAVTQMNTFQALNPAWWYSPPILDLINHDMVSNNHPYVVFQVYCADANAGDNWAVSGVSSGAGPLILSLLQLAYASTAISETIVRAAAVVFEQTAGGITTTLWAAAQTSDVVEIINNGGSDNIIDGNGNDVIDAPTQTISDGEALMLIFNGTKWILM